MPRKSIVTGHDRARGCAVGAGDKANPRGQFVARPGYSLTASDFFNDRRSDALHLRRVDQAERRPDSFHDSQVAKRVDDFGNRPGLSLNQAAIPALSAARARDQNSSPKTTSPVTPTW